MNHRLRQERSTFLLFLGATCVSLMAALPIVTAVLPPATSPTPADAPRPAPLTFEQVDRNHDGFVDREEARAVEGLLDVFALADMRHPDGRLDKVEFGKALSLIAQPR